MTTLGGTLAEMANYIQSRGGQVVGVVTLTNASRGGILTPSRTLVRLLETRFGDAIRETFGVDPAALTASEANYLGHFRDADALRTRGAAASQQRERRLSAKGLSRSEDAPVADRTDSAQDTSNSETSPTDFGSPQRGTTESTRSVSAPRRERLSLKHLTDLERQGQEVADAFLDAVDQAAKKPLPTRPRIPVAPILGGPSKTLSNIVIDLQKGTGKKLTTGKAGRGFVGVYRSGSAATIVRVLNAFRHHRSHHASAAKPDGATVLCSTPFGITDLITTRWGAG